MKKITVIIAFRITEYNAKDAITDLNNCLESIVHSYYDASDVLHEPHEFSLCIVDDHSTIAYKEQISKYDGLKTIFLQNMNEQGHGNTLNFALNQVEADYYLLTDSDCLVDSDWVEQNLYSLNQEDKLCVVGPNWYHQKPKNSRFNFVTRSESKLMKFIFETYVNRDHKTATRIDCRCLAFKKEFLELFPKKVFFSSAVFSNSGQTSYSWRQGKIDMTKTVGYNENLIVYHKHPTSLRKQVFRYYRRGRYGDFDLIYRNIYSSLRRSFFKNYGRRHFIAPILESRVSFIYLWAVHSAFWLGILKRHFERGQNSG